MPRTTIGKVRPSIYFPNRDAAAEFVEEVEDEGDFVVGLGGFGRVHRDIATARRFPSGASYS